MGLSAGYRCFYIELGKFSSYFSLDYQLSYYKLYDPYNYFPKKAKNHIQELVMSLGSQYQPLPRWNLNLSFGFGAYREKFHTIEDNKATDDFYGFTVNARLGLQFNLFKK